MKKASLLIKLSKIAMGVACLALPLTACTKQETPTQTKEAPLDLETTAVRAEYLARQIVLPGEILPYQDVPLYPKIPGFISWIGVDRGSIVKKGQLLCRLTAPELDAQELEARAKAREARGNWETAKSKLES